RDFHVTGVQTCALPIFRWSNWGVYTVRRTTWSAPGLWQRVPHALQSVLNGSTTPASAYYPQSDDWEILAKLRMANEEEVPYLMRSEEQRVGKECRSRWQ